MQAYIRGINPPFIIGKLVVEGEGLRISRLFRGREFIAYTDIDSLTRNEFVITVRHGDQERSFELWTAFPDKAQSIEELIQGCLSLARGYARDPAEIPTG